MKMINWLFDNKFVPPTKWLVTKDAVTAATLYVVGKCDQCDSWGDPNDLRIARTCQKDNTRRSDGDHCLKWEPIP